jgi:subtilisin family serine protease
VKPGDVIKLPYVTAYSAYTLKKEYQGHPDTVAAALTQIPGYVDNMPQQNMTLITAASGSDCVAPTGATEWPFSAEKLRNVLEYNNTRRYHPLSPAVIAIADTGIDPNEDRLFLKINDREVPDNKIDDDENGYIDDVKGANMDRNVTGFPSIYEGFENSEHGTHVSGIALGGLNDDELNKLVKERIEIEELNIVRKDVRPGPSGLTPVFSMPNDYLLHGFQYASLEPSVQIINLSVENDESSGLEAALGGTSFLVVAAAGNDDGLNIDENEKYPAAAKTRDRLISVAAYDGSGALAKFSNWGHGNVDLAAPGCQIDSLLPGGRRGRLSGTSQAAPLVSFTAGLLYAEGLTIPQIKDRILLTTEIDHAKLGNCTGTTGHCVASEGRLDIIKALNIYQDVLVIQKSDGSEAVLYGRASNCIKVDGRCYAVRTQLKRLVHDPNTSENTVWIKSTDNQTHKRSCQLDPTSNINFQEAGSQAFQLIPMNELVDFVPGVY